MRALARSEFCAVHLPVMLPVVPAAQEADGADEHLGVAGVGEIAVLAAVEGRTAGNVPADDAAIAASGASAILALMIVIQTFALLHGNRITLLF